MERKSNQIATLLSSLSLYLHNCNKSSCTYTTVVSEKKGTVICELILERCIYLRNTKKQLKITNCSKQKFLRILSSSQWCLFETSRNITIEVSNFAPLCIKIGGWFCVTTFDVLSTFYSVFVYISYIVKMPVIHWLHSEGGSSPMFSLSKWRDIF